MAEPLDDNMNAGVLKDYYGLLGIPRNATVSEIHKAYWHNASRCHPDKGGNHEDMVQLVEAWRILSDPNKRARYDQLLKYRYDGWHNKKFNEDVQDARKRAKDDAVRSWAEFEGIYQKAFYIFNQDFYGEEIDGKAAGPYSPLMGSKDQGGRFEGASKNQSPGTLSITTRTSFIGYALKTVIVVASIVAALIYYRNYSGIGRYVPLGPQEADSVLMLDTTSGAVYSVETHPAGPASPRKTIVRPFPQETKSPLK